MKKPSLKIASERQESGLWGGGGEVREEWVDFERWEKM
jgi:hypothetical protein